MHASPHAASVLGHGRGRSALERRLKSFLSKFEVLHYQLLHITPENDWLHCRVGYHYLHKHTRLDIDGTMRHELRVLGDEIVEVEVIHDTERMSAFFELVARASAEA